MTGGPDQTQADPSRALLRGGDRRIYPQAGKSLPSPARRPAAKGASNILAIDDESKMRGDLVVERSRGAVGLVGLPVDARRTGKPRLLIDALDQGAADALATRGFRREQILQVAYRLDHGGAAMKEIVREAEQFAAA